MGPETLRNVFTAAAVVLVICSVLLVHPGVTCLVFLSVVLIDVNLLGYMSYWGVGVHAVSCSVIVLAIGIAVDYNVHIAHAYVSQPSGTPPAKRVASAMRARDSSLAW